MSDSTAAEFATEVIWVVAVVGASALVIKGAKRLGRTAVALKTAKLSKVKP